MDVLPKMKDRRLARGNEFKEFCLIQRGKLDIELPAQPVPLFPVERPKDLKDVALLVFQHLLALLHELDDMGFGQETEKRLGIGQSPGNPDKGDVAIPEPCGKFDADPKIDVHDLRRLDELGNKPGRDVMVVDHPQPAYPLDPCVHDQMGGGFAALGVGIVDMVVKGDLIPLFGHFKKVVSLELVPDQPGLARGRGPEIVGKLQLLEIVAPCPDKLLHDLEQHPCRVLGQGTFCSVEDLVLQPPQGLEPVLLIPPVQGLQEVDDGSRDTKALGFGKLLDAKGVEKGVEEFFRISQGVVFIIDSIHDLLTHGQNNGPFNGIFKFPYIAGPSVFGQGIHCHGGEPFEFFPVFLCICC